MNHDIGHILVQGGLWGLGILMVYAVAKIVVAHRKYANRRRERFDWREW